MTGSRRSRRLVNGRGIVAPLIVHGGTGLKPEVVKRLVALGGAKFNVSTDLKHALIDATFEYITAHRSEYNPGKIDIAAKQAVSARVNYWIDLLGCAGKADVRGRSTGMSRIRAFFFDQDGVIIDTERDGHRVAFNRTFAEFGLELRVGRGGIPRTAAGRRRQGADDPLLEDEGLRCRTWRRQRQPI